MGSGESGEWERGKWGEGSEEKQVRGEGGRVGGGGKVLQGPQRWGRQRVALHSHCRELAESS